MAFYVDSQLTGYAMSLVTPIFEVSCPLKESMWHTTSLIHFKNTPAIAVQ